MCSAVVYIGAINPNSTEKKLSCLSVLDRPRHAPCRRKFCYVNRSH